MRRVLVLVMCLAGGVAGANGSGRVFGDCSACHTSAGGAPPGATTIIRTPGGVSVGGVTPGEVYRVEIRTYSTTTSRLGVSIVARQGILLGCVGPTLREIVPGVCTHAAPTNCGSNGCQQSWFFDWQAPGAPMTTQPSFAVSHVAVDGNGLPSGDSSAISTYTIQCWNPPPTIT